MDLQIFAQETPAAEVQQETVPEVRTEAAPEVQQPEPQPEAPAMQPENLHKPDPLDAALPVLARRYGVAPDDREGLAAAIAREQTVMHQRRQAEISQGADRLYTQWMQSAGQTKEIYPDFDLSAELHNPAFVQLLRSCVDVKTAYEVVHKDEIIPAAMQYAARTVEARLAGSLASQISRPAENAMGGTGAVIIGSPVNSLSRRDIADIARRVERGERISFG